MSSFICFYEHENDNRNMIAPEEYRGNDIIDDDVDDEYGDVNLNLTNILSPQQGERLRRIAVRFTL